MLSVLLGILSLLMMKDSLKTVPAPEDCPPRVKSPSLFKTQGGLNLLLTLALLILYPFFLESLGFAAAAFLFLTVMIFILTDQAVKHLPKIFIMAVGLTAVMYVIFKIILRIPFPSGLLI